MRDFPSPRMSSPRESSLDDAGLDDVGSLSQASASLENFVCLGSVAWWTMNHSRLVICVWFVVSVVCIPFAVRFTDVLKLSSPAPRGSKIALAEQQFQQYFPDNALTARYIGYLESANGSILHVPGLDDFCRELHRQLNASRKLSGFMSVTTYKDLTKPLADQAPPMPVPMWTKDETAMLITWSTLEDPIGNRAMEWATGPAHNIFMDLVASRLGSSIGFHGTDSYSEVAYQAVPTSEADFKRIDLICLPVTTAVLYLLVQSWRLLLITGATMGVAAVISFASTYLIGLFFPVMGATPSLMMCLIIAMSVDYSIFLLMRFREEFCKLVGDAGSDQHDIEEQTIEDAIVGMLTTSGATILISGSVLLFAFVFMALFPMLMVASMGIGACVAMATMVLVNLTLVPALLFEFGGFFSTNLIQSKGSCCTVPNLRGCWRCIAYYTTTFPWNACSLLLVVLLSAAISLPCRFLHTSGDLRQIIASHTDLQRVCERVSTKFGGGLEYPFELLLLPTDTTVPILSDRFFKNSSGFLGALKADLEDQVPETKGTIFNFLSYQSGPATKASKSAVPFDILDTMCDLKNSAAKPIRRLEDPYASRSLQDGPPSSFKPLCNYFIDSTTNTRDYRTAAPTAAYGLIMLSIEPLGKSGYAVLDTLRRSCAVHGPTYGIRAVIAGYAAKNLDMVTLLYATFPVAIIATAVTASLFLMVVFRSVVIPIRSMLSNLLTIGFTYGFTVLVYQFGILDFLGMHGMNSNYKSLPWCAPVVVFFIVFGIGLDYDIFLLVRITELRAKGWEPTRAVREGLVTTGGIITAAGVVMACAFGGMCFSAMYQQVMFGFMICIAVIYDTFIARCIVTPAGMSLLGYCNWWPSELSSRAADDDDDDTSAGNNLLDWDPRSPLGE